MQIKPISSIAPPVKVIFNHELSKMVHTMWKAFHETLVTLGERSQEMYKKREWEHERKGLSRERLSPSLWLTCCRRQADYLSIYEGEQVDYPHLSSIV